MSVKTVVVGASSGLGRCIAVGLGETGARVALLARREGRLAEAAKEVGADALAITCDVTDDESARTAIAKAADGLGGIDALGYATGIGPRARLARPRAPAGSPAPSRWPPAPAGARLPRATESASARWTAGRVP